MIAVSIKFWTSVWLESPEVDGRVREGESITSARSFHGQQEPVVR